MKRLPLALPLLLLAGCASKPPATLGELSRRPPAAAVTVSELPADREAAVRGYRAFLAGARDPGQRAEALRRLADLQLEAGELHGETARSREAAELYRRRLADHPGASGNDTVLYQLARASENAGDRAGAEAALDRLVGEHPDSPLIAEAQFRRGEMLFADDRYNGAEAAYSAVLAHGAASGFQAQALYKRGWSLFKLALYPEAVGDFMALLDLRSDAEPAGQDADTLRVLSLAFSYLDGADGIQGWYRRQGHQRHADRVYAALGELYLEKERYSDAAGAFEAFVGAAPTHERAPLMQLRALEIYQKARFTEQALAARERFAALYRLDGPYWAGRAPAAQPVVADALEEHLKALARLYHSRSQKTKGRADAARADAERAGEYYRQYLSGFDERPDAQELRFLYGELLFDGRAYAEAAIQYERAGYGYSINERAAEAAHGALLAYAAHGKALQGPEQLAYEALALDSARRFAARFADHPQAAVALTRAADRLFARGEIGPAAQAAEALLALPKTGDAQRLTAWRILGHASFDAADYLKAEQAYQSALALPKLAPKDRAPLRERLAASIYKQGEQLKTAGELAAAVEHFLRLGTVVAESGIRASAEYDAAALLIQLKAWPRAIAVLEAFRRDYPQHALQPEISPKLALAYVEDGRYSVAAREYLALAAAPGATLELQRQAILQAAELHEKAGEPRQAATVLERFVKSFPSPLEPAVEARQRLIELYTRLDEDKRVRQWRQALIKADREGGRGRTDRTRFLGAQATLVLAEEAFAAYRAVRLVEPIQKTLARKKDSLQKTIKAYTDAADYGMAAIATQATFRIAEVYADFGKALMASARPKGLDELEMEEYELMLEEEAIPFEEKAIALHEVNARRTGEGVYDDWVKDSFKALVRLMPARYAKTERTDAIAETLQ